MDIVLAFSALCILLVVGKIQRVTIRLFQKLYLPASVIGGLLGLVLAQTIGGFLPEATTAGWTRLPGFLINIVFSAPSCPKTQTRCQALNGCALHDE